MQLLYFLIGFTLPLQLGTYFFVPFSYLSGIRIDYLAPALFISDIVAILFLTVSAHLWRRGVTQNLLRPTRMKMVFFFFLLINGLFSLSPGIWAYRVGRLLFLVVFGYAVSRTFTKRAVPPLFWGLMVSTFLELLLCVLQFVQGGSIQGVWYLLGERYLSRSLPSIAQISIAGSQFLRPYGTFSHPNSLAGFYVLIYAFILNNKLVTNNLLKILFLILCALLVVLSFSKTAILCLGVVTLWHVYRTYTCVFCKGAATIVWTVLVGLFMFTITDPLSMVKRVDLFEKSLTLFMRYPLTGTGIGSYLIAQQNLPFLYPYSFHQPVHSIFALTLVEFGLLLFIPVVYFAYMFTKKHLNNSRLYPLLFVVGITGMVDHYWISLQQNNLLIALLCGIIISHEAKKRLLH